MAWPAQMYYIALQEPISVRVIPADVPSPPRFGLRPHSPETPSEIRRTSLRRAGQPRRLSGCPGQGRPSASNDCNGRGAAARSQAPPPLVHLHGHLQHPIRDEMQARVRLLEEALRRDRRRRWDRRRPRVAPDNGIAAAHWSAAAHRVFEFCPNVATLLPTSSKIGPFFANIGGVGPNLSRVAKLGRCFPKRGQSLSTLGQLWPMLAAKFGHSRGSDFDKVGRNELAVSLSACMRAVAFMCVCVCLCDLWLGRRVQHTQVLSSNPSRGVGWRDEVPYA